MNIQKSSQSQVLCTYFKNFLKKESAIKIPVTLSRHLPKIFVDNWNKNWSLKEKNNFAKFYLQHNMVKFNTVCSLYLSSNVATSVANNMHNYITCNKNQCIPILNLAKRAIKN